MGAPMGPSNEHAKNKVTGSRSVCQRWRQSSVNSKYGYCLGISVWKFRSTLSFLRLSGGSGPPSPGGLSGLFVSRTASLKGLTALFRDLIFVRQVLPFGYEGPAEGAKPHTRGSDVIRHCEIFAQHLSIFAWVLSIANNGC